MRRIAVAHRAANRIAVFIHWLTRGRAHVDILTDGGNALTGTGKARTRCQRVGRAAYGHALIVTDYDVVDAHVAVVGDHIGPHDRLIFGDLRSSRSIGIFTVGELLDIKARARAEVMARIGVNARIAKRRTVVHRLCAHRTDVGVLARCGGAAAGAGHRLADSKRCHRAGHNHALIVGDHHVDQIKLAGVVDHVGPVHRIADRNHRTGWRIGIAAVGELLDRDVSLELQDTRVDGQVRLARRQRNGAGDAGDRIDVRIKRIVTHVGLGVRFARHWDHLHEIDQTRIKITEQVVAVSVGDRGSDDAIRRTVAIVVHPQIHHTIRHTEFAWVLRAITVFVNKDGVAEHGGGNRYTNVVRWVGIANRIANRITVFIHRLTGGAADVGVLTDRRDALTRAGEACARCQ